MFDRFVALTAGETPRTAAASLGVDNTYITKLRTGWRPSRVREDLWDRLVAVLASAARGPMSVREGGSEWNAKSPDYLRGQRDLLSELITWATDKRAKIDPALARSTEELSRAVEDLEAEAEVLDQLPPLPAPAPKKQKRRA